MSLLGLTKKIVSRRSRGGLLSRSGLYKARRRKGNRARNRRGIMRRGIFANMGGR